MICFSLIRPQLDDYNYIQERMMKKICTLILICVICQSFVLFTGGNSWNLKNGYVDNSGYSFTKVPARFETYFYSGSETTFTLTISLKTSKPITYTMTYLGFTTPNRTIATSEQISVVQIGQFTSRIGYNKIVINIAGSTPSTTGLVTQFHLDGVFTGLTYVTDSSWFYWGRRGPSCHLTSQIPPSAKVSYYYSEIRVPIGFDPVGSYYMANGFGQGYFGIQVNSLTQRRVLFSVWSGFSTDDPNAVPAEYKVVLKKAGPGVTVNDFGGQGSGGQSYLEFNWTTGNSYAFLTKAQPLQENATTYTSWFRDPSNTTTDGWRLIASWTRPKIQTTLTGIYHFLESFSTETGNKVRRAEYSNQRYYDQSNTWKQVQKMYFSKDSTANENQRRDTNGGVIAATNGFFLTNCGFFDKTKPYGTVFTRNLPTNTFNIDFSALPY